MRRTAIVGAAAIVAIVAIVALGLAGWPASSYRAGDFFQFWAEPHALLDGGDPYDAGWWSAFHARTGDVPLFPAAVYPPYEALALLPLALLPLPYAAAAWLVGQLVAVGVALVALARRLLAPAERVVFLGIAVAFQPLWLLVVGGNVTGLLFAILAAAYLAAVEGRWTRCGMWLGLLALKPHPFAFLAVAALALAPSSSRRSLALGALSTGGVLAAVMLVLRPAWYVEWGASAFALQSAPGSNATAWTIGRAVGLEAPAIGGALVLVAIAAFALWVRRARPATHVALAAAIPLSLAVAPHGWSYDQLHLLIPLAVVVARVGGLGGRARGIALSLVALGAVALPWALYALAFRRGGEELSVVTPLLAALAVAAVLPRFGDRTALAPPVASPS